MNKVKDKLLKNLITLEEKKQENSINLIASENYISNDILNIQKSKLSNKYAEGYKNKRYYGGCKYVNKIEQIAINRAKKLFNANYVNVQPHSGSQANQAVYISLCKKNDVILSMNLNDGGHLSHGYKLSFVYKFYKIIQYNTSINSKYIDYNKIERLSKLYKPKLIIAGTSSYSRIINWKIIKQIAKNINAYTLADISHFSGLVVTNLYPNPIKIFDVITSTTQKTLRGPRGGLILSKHKNNYITKKLDLSVFPGIQSGPHMQTIAAKAACFKEAKNKKFMHYQKKTIKNAKYFSKYFIHKGFNIITNGSDTHLFVINLKNKNINGNYLEKKLEKINIIVNKNTIPDDNLPANITSGIRIGTPAITTRNIGFKQIRLITNWINIITSKNIKKRNSIKKNINKMCNKYPIYKNL